MANLRQGISLVEVLIAGSIAVGIGFVINNYLSKANQQQAKMEKKQQLLEIKKQLRAYLVDLNAWNANPGEKMPSGVDAGQFYFFDGQKQLQAFSWNSDRGKTGPLACTRRVCHFVFYNYQGQMALPDKVSASELANFPWRAEIIFPSEQEASSRNFLPRLQISWQDFHSQEGLRVREKDFVVDPAFENNQHLQAQKNPYPQIRGECIANIYREFPEINLQDGIFLCSRSQTLAPFECLKIMVRTRGQKLLFAQVLCWHAENLMPITCFEQAGGQGLELNESERAILCSGAVSLTPIECYQKAQQEVSAASKYKSYLVKVCARALDTNPALCFKHFMSMGSDISASSLTDVCPQYR